LACSCSAGRRVGADAPPMSGRAATAAWGVACKAGAGRISAAIPAVILMGVAMAATSVAAVRRQWHILFAIALLLVAAKAAIAFSTPQRTGWVTDAAHILDDSTMSSLSTRLQNLQSETGDEVVVVTVPDLQGTTIENWGNVLGDSWKIGKVNGRNDGVVLVVAPNDRRVRIAVGYGLANRISDSIAASIISDHILPYFRNGDMAGGITAGITSIALQLGIGGAANSVQPEPVAMAPVRLSFWAWLVHGVAPSPHMLMILFWVGVGIVVFVVMALNAANVGNGTNRPRSLSDEYDNAYNSDSGWSNNNRGGSSGSSGGGGGGSFGGGASGSW
jgi:uncharacterized protein